MFLNSIFGGTTQPVTTITSQAADGLFNAPVLHVSLSNILIAAAAYLAFRHLNRNHRNGL